MVIFNTKISYRKNQKQLWVDKEFIDWLRKVKAEKELKGELVRNFGELTRLMVKTDAIKELEKQLLEGKNLATDIRLKLDSRRFFG